MYVQAAAHFLAAFKLTADLSVPTFTRRVSLMLALTHGRMEPSISAFYLSKCESIIWSCEQPPLDRGTVLL